MKTIGKFKYEVWEPYPCWCSLLFQGMGDAVEMRFDHKDIADLKHLVSQMEKEAKLKLKNTGDEDEV